MKKSPGPISHADIYFFFIYYWIGTKTESRHYYTGRGDRSVGIVRLRTKIHGVCLKPSPLILSSFIGQLYQPWMIDGNDCGVTGVIKDWDENRSTRRKLAPVSFWPPQIPRLTCPGLEPGRRGGKPETNRQSYGRSRGQASIQYLGNNLAYIIRDQCHERACRILAIITTEYSLGCRSADRWGNSRRSQDVRSSIKKTKKNKLYGL
jgi:hypothetical protein